MPKNNARAVLRKYGFTTKKKFGQNFLTDESVLEQIVYDAGITKEDHVLEIGPGVGSLTGYLCESAGQVTSVEIDETLLPILREEMSDYDNFHLVAGDVLETDLLAIAREREDLRFKVVANLPYYITTPILMKLLEQRLPLDSITVMVQKEVAERMQAAPGSKAYGALSLAVQYYASAEMILVVGPESFLPPPKVSSAVIRLNRYEEAPVDVKDEKLMFRLIRDAFNQRRKTLANALSNASNLSLSKEEIMACICQLGEKETVRGEALSLEKFARLSNIIQEKQEAGR